MSELIAALNQLEKEKGIDKDVIMEAIENMTVLELATWLRHGKTSSVLALLLLLL